MDNPNPSKSTLGDDFLKKRSDDLADLRKEFHAVQLDKVIPLSSWLRDKPWNIVWVRWFLVYALFPFVLLNLLQGQAIGFKDVAWAFGLYFSLTWLIVLHFCIRPEKVELALLGQIGLFTAFVGIILVLVGQTLPIMDSFYKSTKSGDLLSRWLGYILGVGTMEEGIKALPIFLFVYRKNLRFRPLTYAFIGAVSGLAFGVAEAVNYSLSYTKLARAGAVDYYLVIQLLRLISLPLLHACWSALVGYFLGLAAMYRSAARALALIGLLLAMVLHGTYDTFADDYGWVGASIAALSLLILISYIRAGDAISKDVMRTKAV